MSRLRTLAFVEVAEAPTAGGEVGAPLVEPWSYLPVVMAAALDRVLAEPAGKRCEVTDCEATIGWSKAGKWRPVALVAAPNRIGVATAVCATCSPLDMYHSDHQPAA